MTIAPIDSELTVQKIYQYFSNCIINGDLKPGDMLPSESQLAESFNVGRGTVREAKKMLSSVGVFEERRGQGTFVTTQVKPAMFNPLLFSMIIESQCQDGENISKDDDIYELRIMFETAAMDLVIDKASDEEIEDLKKCIDEHREGLLSGNASVEFCMGQEMKFHTKIYEMTGNALIVHIGEVINDLFRQGIKKTMKNEDSQLACVNNHEAIYNSIRSRDKVAMRTAVLDSLVDWKNR